MIDVKTPVRQSRQTAVYSVQSSVLAGGSDVDRIDAMVLGLRIHRLAFCAPGELMQVEFRQRDGFEKNLGQVPST